jgi:bacteriocin-like protein
MKKLSKKEMKSVTGGKPAGAGSIPLPAYCATDSDCGNGLCLPRYVNSLSNEGIIRLCHNDRCIQEACII